MKLLPILLFVTSVFAVRAGKFPRPKSPPLVTAITMLMDRIARQKNVTPVDIVTEALIGDLIEGFDTVDALEVIMETFPNQGVEEGVELMKKNKLKKRKSWPRPIVKTGLGSVQGVTVRGRSGTRYHYFLGLPYASTPERFQSAAPPLPWKGVREARKEKPPCMQYAKLFENIGGSEDCLYADVITPQLPVEGAKKYPVVVWIHGGGFKFGTGSVYIHGPEKFMRENVVLVSFAYRLGPFGFLCANTEDAPGNIGLKDTVMLLRWIQKYIAAFGGDPDNVTLYGVSTGGIFVDLLTMSPMGQGLFHKGVIQSAAAIAPWAFSDLTLKYVFRLGKYLGIDTVNLDEMVTRLKLEDPADVVSAFERLGFDESPVGDYFTFVPCAEKPVTGEEMFIDDHPEKLLKAGNFSSVPLMIGYNGREGLSIMEVLQVFPNFLESVDDIFEWLLPESLLDKTRSPKERSEIADKVKHFYFGNETIGNATLDGFVNMVGDAIFKYPIYRNVRLRLKHSKHPVYFLNFDYDGEYALLKQYTDITYPGVSHADDLGYTFNLPYSKIDEGKPDTVMASRRLVKMVANFAKYGDPTPVQDSIFPVRWKPMIDDSNFIYMHQTKDLDLVEGPHLPEFLFWDQIFANYSGNNWSL